MAVNLDSVIGFILLGMGAYLQAATGFGLGLLVVGSAAVTGIEPIATMTALVSVATFVTTAAALPGEWARVCWRDFRLAIAGLIPAGYLGLVILGYLSDKLVSGLHTLLAATLLVGGAVLVVALDARREKASDWQTLTMGSIGGLLSGLFATSGPPLIYHLYRQPYGIVVTRATLLVAFAVAALVRMGYAAIKGDFSSNAVLMAVGSVPVVFGAGLLGKRVVSRQVCNFR